MVPSLTNKLLHAPLLCTTAVLGIVGSPCLSAQTPVIVDDASGLRLMVDGESTLPALRLVLPGQPDSNGILIIFPEHVTVREHGKAEGVHIYLWRSGEQGDRPVWRRVGQSLEYEMELKSKVHMLARATLEFDGVRYHYELANQSGVGYDMVQAISDPRLFQSFFRDVRLKRTYVHRKDGFELLASDMPARLTMPLNQWLPSRYLDSYTWPVPPPEKRVVKDEGITYYNASRRVDQPFIATVSEDGKWVAATWNPDTGNVWTNPELTCQHADSESPLKAGGTASLEVKTFVFRGKLDQVLVKIRQDHRSPADYRGAMRPLADATVTATAQGIPINIHQRGRLEKGDFPAGRNPDRALALKENAPILAPIAGPCVAGFQPCRRRAGNSAPEQSIADELRGTTRRRTNEGAHRTKDWVRVCCLNSKKEPS